MISVTIPAGVSEWQTMQTQNLLGVRPCGFKSRRRQYIIKLETLLYKKIRITESSLTTGVMRIFLNPFITRTEIRKVQTMELLIENIASVEDTDLQKKPEYITEERWERIQRLGQEADRKRSLLAGKLLYRMCKSCQIENPVYGTIANAKPVLISHPQISFNLSHSGDYVVLVYEKNTEAIGVDIQLIRLISEGMQKKILHKKEWEYPINNTLLNRIWAIKESVVKMTGKGLATDFRSLYVDMEQGIVTSVDGTNVPYKEPTAPDGYVMAVAYVEGRE